MTQSVSNITTLVNIVTAPSAAFESLKVQPKIFFPLLLLVIMSVIMLASYYSTVDYNWMVDQMVAAQGDKLTTSEKEQMRTAMTAMPQTVMMIISIVSAAVGIPVILAAMTAYLLLMNKLLDGQNFTFPAWLSLVCWTSIPSVFTSIASLVNIVLAHNGQLSIESINPITFNSLLFQLEPKDPLFAPLNSLDPMYIWSTVLLALGHSNWTGRNISQSALIVLAPSLLIYTVWIAIALR
jgi:hypothetical protein